MFDRKRFSKKIKDAKLTTASLFEKLEAMDIGITQSTLEAYRKGTIKHPPIDKLDIIADVLNCSIQDFFSDADKKREQIAVEEISSKPSKYSQSISNAFLSEYPKHTQQLIKKCLLLTDEQQKELLEHVEEMARKNMEF